MSNPIYPTFFIFEQKESPFLKFGDLRSRGLPFVVVVVMCNIEVGVVVVGMSPIGVVHLESGARGSAAGVRRRPVLCVHVTRSAIWKVRRKKSLSERRKICSA